MKLRTDFVTNSSSSSFICVEIKSEKLKSIMEKYSDFIEELREYVCCEEMEPQEGFYMRQDEGGYVDVPSKVEDVVDILATFFEEFAEYCDEFEDRIPGFVQELRDNEKEIIDDITQIDWTYGDVGWGGDSDSRYYPENYSEDALESIYESIMEENGYESKEDVTEEDFCEYVGNQTSTEEHRYYFDKEKGTSEYIHSFELL